MATFKKDIHLGTKVPVWGTSDYNDKSVTEAKLANGAVTQDKLGTDVNARFDADELDISGKVNYTDLDAIGEEEAQELWDEADPIETESSTADFVYATEEDIDGLND